MNPLVAKVGFMPLWGWLAVGGGGLLGLSIAKKKTTAAASPAPAAPVEVGGPSIPTDTTALSRLQEIMSQLAASAGRTPQTGTTNPNNVTGEGAGVTPTNNVPTTTGNTPTPTTTPTPQNQRPPSLLDIAQEVKRLIAQGLSQAQIIARIRHDFPGVTVNVPSANVGGNTQSWIDQLLGTVEHGGLPAGTGSSVTAVSTPPSKGHTAEIGPPAGTTPVRYPVVSGKGSTAEIGPPAGITPTPVRVPEPVLTQPPTIHVSGQEIGPAITGVQKTAQQTISSFWSTLVGRVGY